jgi:DNA-binding NarL/FixJ family response regulator
VDDHLLVSQALAFALCAQTDMNVIGTASTADDAIGLAKSEQPDVVLLDIVMTGLSPFEAVSHFRQDVPKIRIAFLTAHLNDAYVEEAIRVEAAGYIDKSEPLADLVGAVRQVACGQSYYSPSVRDRLVVPRDIKHIRSRERTRRSLLSPRELDVLRYISRGLSAKDAALIMHISERTVNNHRTNLMNKLDIHDRVKLARYAIREGLATL